MVDQNTHLLYNTHMIEVKNKNQTREFETLALAMDWAKTLNEFVTISVNGHEFVGRFGADEIKQGVLPDGHTYTWKKRRI